MKHLLILAPNTFPPHLVSGSLRNVKMVKYLNRCGWRCTVLTTSVYQDYSERTLEEDVPETTEVTALPVPLFGLKKAINRRVDTPATGQHAGGGGTASAVRRMKKAVFGVLRMLLLVPDDHILWGISLYRYFRSRPPKRRYDAVLASGPPFSAHVLGRIVARRAGCAFIPDYRDPWMGHEQSDPRNAYRRMLETGMERSNIRAAAFVPCATVPMVDDFRRAHPRYAERFVHLANGYDEDDFSDGFIPVVEQDKLNIVYTGAFGRVYDPTDFLLELKSAVTERHMADDVRVTFAGIMTDDLSPLFDDPVLARIVRYEGKVSHERVLELIRSADVLLLLIFPGFTGYTVMTNKLFEYIAARRHVLGIVPDGIARTTIGEYGLGSCCYPGDRAGIRAEIDRLIDAWRAGSLRMLPVPEPVFTRRYQFDRLAGYLDKAVAQ